MGLEELGLFKQITDPQQGGPLGTLTALKALRAQQTPGMTAPQSVSQGTPFKTTEVDMPDLSGGSVDAAMEQGAQRAEREATGKKEAGEALGMSPMLVNLAKEMAPTDQDRDAAFVKGGVGMALAGGQTGNFLTALAAGLGQGQDHFQALRAARAERALKEGQLNSDISYKSGMLGNAQAQTEVERGKSEAMARYYDNQGNLIPSEIEKNKAAAAASRAQAGYDAARVRDIEGGAGGIPASVWKKAMTEASLSLRTKAFSDESSRAAAIQQRALQLAKADMDGRGLPTANLPAFAPIAAPPQDAPPAAKKVPWMEGADAIEPQEGEATPLLGNPAVFVPMNQLKTLAAQGTFGAYDPGQGFNMGVNQLTYIKNDLQQLNKVGGHQLAAVMKNIDDMTPKQGVFVATEQNYDKLHSMFNDVYTKLQQDEKNAFDPNVSNKLQNEARQRLALEKRILYRLSGTKNVNEWKRFGGEEKATPDDDGADLLEKYLKK